MTDKTNMTEETTDDADGFCAVEGTAAAALLRSQRSWLDWDEIEIARELAPWPSGEVKRKRGAAKKEGA